MTNGKKNEIFSPKNNSLQYSIWCLCVTKTMDSTPWNSFWKIVLVLVFKLLLLCSHPLSYTLLYDSGVGLLQSPFSFFFISSTLLK